MATNHTHHQYMTHTSQSSNYYSRYEASPAQGFPELKDLSISELRDLNADEGSLIEFMQKLTPIRRLHAEKDRLDDLNVYLAKENLSKQPVIEEHKKRILKKLDEVHSLRTQFEALSLQHQELSESFAPSAIAEQLLLAAVDTESQSDDIANDFLDGKIQLNEFMRTFMEKRTLSHCRRAKEERLQHQLRELQKAGF